MSQVGNLFINKRGLDSSDSFLKIKNFRHVKPIVSTNNLINEKILNEPADTHSCFGVPSSNPNVCSSRGTCVEKDKCICTNNFYGRNCEFTIGWTWIGMN